LHVRKYGCVKTCLSFNNIIKVLLHLIRKSRNNFQTLSANMTDPAQSKMQIGENLALCRIIWTFFFVQMLARNAAAPRLQFVTGSLLQARFRRCGTRSFDDAHNVHKHAPATLTRKPLQPDER